LAAADAPDDTTRAAPRSIDTDADLIWRLLGLQPEMQVLDLACGHGPLANRLAARGCRVTGLDSSTIFLDRARADAAALGVEVDYVAGDMRDLPWTDRFDRIVNCCSRQASTGSPDTARTGLRSRPSTTA
jgi:cyclopropane fatty-acyl-phospholipid synthase-like methyltransferase